MTAYNFIIKAEHISGDDKRKPGKCETRTNATFTLCSQCDGPQLPWMPGQIFKLSKKKDPAVTVRMKNSASRNKNG